MSSVSDDPVCKHSARRCNPDRHYSRKRISFAENCEGRARDPIAVPVFENCHQEDENSSCGDHSGRGGDCHIIGRHNLLKSESPLPPSPGIHCGICKDPVKEATTSHCGHIFCRQCIDKKLKEKPCCPICESSFENKIRLLVNQHKDDENEKCEEQHKIKKRDLRAGLLQRSTAYLKKLKDDIKANKFVGSVGNFLKETTKNLLTVEVLIAVSVVAILSLLIWYGFIPKIRILDFYFDLYNFVIGYKFIEKTPESPFPDHKEIQSEVLPDTVYYHIETEKSGDCDSNHSKSIFKSFLNSLGLLEGF